jgi:hypothetical protein
MVNGTGDEIAAKLRRVRAVERGAAPVAQPAGQVSRVVSVCNPKSGTARSTTAVFLAHALARLGRRVLLADADPDEQVINWDRLAPFPFPTVAAPVRYLDTLLPGPAADVDHVVIDTPARRRHAAVRLSAMYAADLVVSRWRRPPSSSTAPQRCSPRSPTSATVATTAGRQPRCC